MSYRFGLSPADVVTDSKGNTINTTLSLYVAESDANARANALASVPVTQGSWSYTSSTYKSLWARTATSDAFPVVSADAVRSALDASTAVTDNGDGGFTIAGNKLSGYTWTQDTFVEIDDAVAMSSTTPPADSLNGFAGSANTASRGDHSHLITPQKPYAIAYASGDRVSFHPTPSSSSTILNRGSFSPLWLSTVDWGPLAITALSVEVTTAASAGGTIRFGLWRATSNGALNFSAANKIAESGDISSTTTGFKTFTISAVLPPGLYYGGALMHTAVCSLRQSDHGMLVYGGGGALTVMYLDGLTGGFPTSGGANINGDISPSMSFVVA